ncbi:MAG: hypothetical protein Q7J82_01175 [Coriobacteriia bacterium]|nr:hypothetical protein [Coriobacteriia bacterium]
MPGVFIAVALLSGVLAYVVGYAFIAPCESILRSKAGGMVLAMCVLVALLVPLTLMSIAGQGGPLAWPAGLSRDLYRRAWIGSMSLGLLAGLRVWRLGPRLRGSHTFTLDESTVSRAESQLLLTDTLEEALDVLGREKVTTKDVERLSARLRIVGSRFWFQVPEKNSDAYRLVAKHVPPGVAATVTGLLLEGAERKK